MFKAYVLIFNACQGITSPFVHGLLSLYIAGIMNLKEHVNQKNMHYAIITFKHTPTFFSFFTRSRAL
jgi:hypothetical protein